ncbi:MAG: redoxin domain-containing protein [Armatimonadota bacterium]|nr:redoxin domain-containing protein [Armatimonadota bacterium]
MFQIEFLYWEDCPSHEPALKRLRQVVEALGVRASVRVIRVDTDEQARALRFAGSPTIRVNGVDLFPAPGEAYRLTCRVFLTPDGRVTPIPTVAMLEDALRSALDRPPRAASTEPADGGDAGGGHTLLALEVGSPLIPFTLRDAAGHRVGTDDYRSARVLGVVFTCLHCPYALAWEDRLIRIQRDYAGRGVQLLLVNPTDPRRHPEDGEESMRRRAQERGYPFPFLADPAQEVARRYGATRTPEVFLFDSAGILRYHGGVDDNSEDPAAVRHPYLRQALDALLAGRTPPLAETPVIGCRIVYGHAPGGRGRAD